MSAHCQDDPSVSYRSAGDNRFITEHSLAVFESNDWMTRVARIGYFAKGIVYICVGLFSALAAFQGRAKASDSRAALEKISEQPFGRVMLISLAVGLLCFVVWRLIEAIANPGEYRSGFKAVMNRVRALFSGAVYSGITIAAVRTLMGGSSGGGGGDRTARDSTAKLMATPYGSWAVMLIGLALIGYGIFQLRRAYRRSFERKLDLSSLGADGHRWVTRVCAFGLAARGFVFGIVGVFLILAGLRSDPGEARGLSGALNALRGEAYGPILFAVVALGLAGGLVYFLRAERRFADLI